MTPSSASPLERVRGALPTTFLLHALATALAAAFALVAATQLGAAPIVGPGGSELLEAVHRSAKARGLVVALTGLGLLVPWLLATPLLTVAWMRAHEEPGVRSALAFAARRYLRTMAVSLLASVGLVAVALLLALPIGTYLLLDGPNARTQDLATLASALPFALGLGAWAAFHDLARAAVAVDVDSASAAVRAGRRALSMTAISAYVGLFGAGAALTLLGVWLGVAFAPMALVTGQLIALARALTRSRWFASAVRRVG